MVAPFIFVDELIYSELARSLADSGERLVRDVPTTGYGIGYPLLIAPAYALFDNLPDAYAAVKTVNALLMSLAAVPAYLLARRVVGQWWALGAAVLAVAIPSMAYTGTVMTENAFYPLFLVIAWQLARVLEHPTVRGQVLLLALIAIAYTIRVQAIVLVPAALTAPILLALFERRRSTLRPFLSAYGIVAAGGVALVALPARARTRPLGAARRLQRRGRGRLRRAPRARLPRLAPRRARPLPRGPAGRGDIGPAGECRQSAAAAPGAPRCDDRADGLALRRRGRVRLPFRGQPDSGAEPLRRRTAAADLPRRLGRARGAAAPSSWRSPLRSSPRLRRS